MEPNIWGPIYWDLFHTTASACKTRKECLAFQTIFPKMASTIKCPTCTQHITNFMARTTVESFLFRFEELSALRFTWSLHNSVNQSLGKPPFPWQEAHKIYILKEQVFIQKQEISAFSNFMINSSNMIKALIQK